MKHTILLILATFLFGINNNLEAQSSPMDAFTVQVDGLGCPFCAYGLEKKFKELKGIKEVQIELEKGIMDFEYPSDKNLTIEKVESQVKKAGYTPVNVTVTRADGTIEKSEQKSNVKLSDGEAKELEFYVAGNCGMCKSRIERAALEIEGVESALWDKESKLLKVKVAANVEQEALEMAMVKAGHDTKTMKADNSTYNKLPGCCQYDRE